MVTCIRIATATNKISIGEKTNAILIFLNGADRI
jgi:hypothetical protein